MQNLSECGENFQQVCPNCLPRILRRFFRDIIFDQINKTFNSFRTWAVFFQNMRKVAAGLSKLHFTCPEEIFQEQSVSTESLNTYFFLPLSTFFSKIDQKKSAGPSKLHFTCPEMMFQEKKFQPNNYIFEWENQSLKLSERKSFCQVSGKSFSDSRRKVSAGFSKLPFHVYRVNIWGNCFFFTIFLRFHLLLKTNFQQLVIHF